MSGVKHTPVLIATSSAADGVYVISQGEERRAIGTIRATRSLVDTMCAAPDLLAVASQPVVHIVEGDETIVRLMIGKVEVCAFERGDWRATALIMFDAEQRAAIARARGERHGGGV